MICFYCKSENATEALVCSTCSRDIAVPATLLAERDALVRKREATRDELRRARGELEMIHKRSDRRRS